MAQIIPITIQLNSLGAPDGGGQISIVINSNDPGVWYVGPDSQQNQGISLTAPNGILLTRSFVNNKTFILQNTGLTTNVSCMIWLYSTSNALTGTIIGHNFDLTLASPYQTSPEFTAPGNLWLSLVSQ